MRARRNKFWMQIGALLCVGSVSVIAIVHAVHSPMNGIAEIASALSQVTTTLPASAASLDADSASAIHGAEPRGELASIFSDRFAFGRAEDAGDRTQSGPPITEPLRLSSARPRNHWQYRHRTSRHRPVRLAHSHLWLYDFLNLSRFEPRVAGGR
jgi:hypothetical protein